MYWNLEIFQPFFAEGSSEMNLFATDLTFWLMRSWFHSFFVYLTTTYMWLPNWNAWPRPGFDGLAKNTEPNQSCKNVNLRTESFSHIVAMHIGRRNNEFWTQWLKSITNTKGLKTWLHFTSSLYLRILMDLKCEHWLKNVNKLMQTW